MRGRKIGNNSPGNLKNSGSMADRIANTLIYGGGRKSAVDLEIGEIKKALSDFAKQVKNKNGQKSNIWKRRKKLLKSKKIEVSR